MALEATGRSYEAQDIYKVLRRSKNREIKGQAKRLNEGLEAMDMLKFGRVGEVSEVSEVSKMWTASFKPMSGDREKRYSQVYFEKDADGRPTEDGVFAVEDAKQVLMFASKYKGGISKNRIIKAFDFLKQRSEEASLAARREAAALRRQQEKQAQDDADAAAAAAASAEGTKGVDGKKQEKTDQEVFALKKKPWEKNASSDFPKGGAGLVSLMGDMSSLEQRIQGEWTLAIKAGGSNVDVLQRDSPIKLSPGGQLTAVEPSGPFLSVSKEGQWELDANDRVVKLDYSSSKWVGLLDTGGAQEGWEVLALDDKLLVALESRPGAEPKGGAGATGTKKFVIDKYRLLVRT